MNANASKVGGKVLEGVVVSNRMAKSVSVLVERVNKVPKYRKYIRVRKKYLAHADTGALRPGERVRIREVRPLSKRKRWIVIGKVDEVSKASAVSETS